ncbi:hypothetical protein KIS1582_2681 [Cytobacillus firmus]|uniref:Uncharacterized protein n=1 Tax=Cytobacillus firmus TaxID=1399 RepID=A0A800NA42_CYTFI|nr:hypothetical protein KIS1582_2681 [Cytobacillus firmus]
MNEIILHPALQCESLCKTKLFYQFFSGLYSEKPDCLTIK